MALDGAEEAVGVVHPGLAQVAEEEDRAAAEGADAPHVCRELFGGAVGGLVPSGEVAPGEGGAAADGAVFGAAFDGEGGHDGVFEPMAKGGVVEQVAVAHNGAHDGLEIQGEVLQGVGDVGLRVDVYLAGGGFPGEIRHVAGCVPRQDAIEQPPQRFFGGIAPQDVIHKRIADELCMEVGGGVAAEDDGGVGVVLFGEPGDFECAVGVGQPVQVYAESAGAEVGDGALGVVAGRAHHAGGEVEDARLVAVLLDVGQQGGEAHRVHVEDGCGGDEVGDGSPEGGALAEVVDARGVEEDDIVHGSGSVYASPPRAKKAAANPMSRHTPLITINGRGHSPKMTTKPVRLLLKPPGSMACNVMARQARQIPKHNPMTLMSAMPNPRFFCIAGVTVFLLHPVRIWQAVPMVHGGGALS